MGFFLMRTLWLLNLSKQYVLTFFEKNANNTCDVSGTTSLPSSMQLHQLIVVNNFHCFESTTGGVDSDCQTEDDNASGCSVLKSG